MDSFRTILEQVGDLLWHDTVLCVVLGVGILFTIRTRFSQWHSLTHGVSVLRGKYDRKDDPGAIGHFQALSAALSATVGLGNIGGVALGISLGGPGAVFWMWVIGLFGMALKTAEVHAVHAVPRLDPPVGSPRRTDVRGARGVRSPWAAAARQDRRRRVRRDAAHLVGDGRQHVPGVECRRGHAPVVRPAEDRGRRAARRDRRRGDPGAGSAASVPWRARSCR